jgi:hypothetical protein
MILQETAFTSAKADQITDMTEVVSVKQVWCMLQSVSVGYFDQVLPGLLLSQNFW